MAGTVSFYTAFGEACSLYERAVFKVFDEAHPDGPVKRDVFGESLLLEIPWGVVIGVG